VLYSVILRAILVSSFENVCTLFNKHSFETVSELQHHVRPAGASHSSASPLPHLFSHLHISHTHWLVMGHEVTYVWLCV